MGTQSAFFGPLKYALLPQHLRADELVEGNGLIGSGTFVAIVTGTLAGTLLPPVAVAACVVAIAALGYGQSRRIPDAPSTTSLTVGWNPLRESVRAVADVSRDRLLLLAILAISWFWLFGSLFLAQLPSLCTEVLGGDERLMGTLLVVFSVKLALRNPDGILKPGLPVDAQIGQGE